MGYYGLTPSPFHSMTIPRLCRLSLACLLKAAGSLQLAVVLITVYAVVLAWATLVEHDYHEQGAAAARFGIYGSGWFFALNVLLAVNVLGAMLIRIPWKLRQTGFVVTHAGILVLMAGCLLTRQYGIEAQLPIYEGHTAHRALEESLHFQLRVLPLGGSHVAATDWSARLCRARSIGRNTPSFRGFPGMWPIAVKERSSTRRAFHWKCSTISASPTPQPVCG